MNKKVAVVVNCYNHGLFIKQCIDSIQKQTYKDVEIEVYDAASTDGTFNLLLNIYKASEYLYFEKFLYTFPIGITRWMSIRSALYDDRIGYIAIVDGDDYWHPRKLEKQMEIFENDSEVKLCFSDCYYDHYEWKQKDCFPVFFTEYGSVAKETFHDRYPVLNSDHFFNLLTRYNYMPCPTLIFERKALQKVIGNPMGYTSAEDYDWILKMTSLYKASYVPEPLAYYRIHSEQITTKTKARCTAEEIDVVKRAIHFRKLNRKQINKAYKHIFWLYCKLLFKEVMEYKENEKHRKIT